MNHAKKIDYNERLTTAAEAKKALLQKFKLSPLSSPPWKPNARNARTARP
jgi:hypothetical protein